MHTIYVEKKLHQQSICEKFLTSVNNNHPELKLNYTYEHSTDLSVIFEIKFSIEDLDLADTLVKKLYRIN